MIKAVIFDLWHTLGYNDKSNENLIVATANIFGEKFSMDFLKKVEEGAMIRRFPSLRDQMISLCMRLGKEPKGQVLEKLAKLWDPSTRRVMFFPDTMPYLKSLKKRGIKVAVVSNTGCFTCPLFKEGENGLFDAVALSFELGVLKPDPKMFKWALKKLGTKPEETLMVGDTLTDDILPAEKLGMKCVLIRRENDRTSVTKNMGKYRNMIKTLPELDKFL
jgi:HAD superfamily hydrolase (TIGR01549 family)